MTDTDTLTPKLMLAMGIYIQNIKYNDDFFCLCLKQKNNRLMKSSTTINMATLRVIGLKAKKKTYISIRRLSKISEFNGNFLYVHIVFLGYCIQIEFEDYFWYKIRKWDRE